MWRLKIDFINTCPDGSGPGFHSLLRPADDVPPNGSSVPSDQMLPASGCIHPGTPEMVQLLPEEERTEEFIAVYTDFPLSTGENDGGAAYTVPDRILWNEETWRVVRVRSWAMFGYVQALAIRMHEYSPHRCGL